MFDKCGSTSCLFHCLITGCANPSIDSVQLILDLPTLNPFPLAGKICGLFFPHSSFSSGLPSPSPPSSGQVSRECCSKGCTRGCICLAFLHCVLSNESSNVANDAAECMACVELDEERFSNHPESKLSLQPLSQQALQALR